MPSRGPQVEVKNEIEQDKQAVIAALRATILDSKASTLDKTRAADCLGRFVSYGWFSKPQDAQQETNVIDTNTAQRIADLSERLLGFCPHCGGTL